MTAKSGWLGVVIVCRVELYVYLWTIVPDSYICTTIKIQLAMIYYNKNVNIKFNVNDAFLE